MRVLVSCPDCSRQFDASGRPVGDRFRCFCGCVLEIAAPREAELAVLRCPSCGAGALEGKPSCGFCGTSYSLFDADRTVVCGACLTRCSQRARFCHHCATALVANATVGTATDLRCPACADRRLSTRSAASVVGEGGVLAFLECGGCAGLWLEHEALRLVAERARALAQPFDPVAHKHALARFRAGHQMQPVSYRPCPVCKGLMARQNYGRASGVIVDQCVDHGIWFDHGELEHVLAWVKAGGEERATALRAAETQHNNTVRQAQRWGSWGDESRESAAVDRTLSVIDLGFALLRGWD